MEIKEEEYINEYSICNCIKLGEKAPDFIATTTTGEINFHEYIKDHWTILFSHPADFTPVCTTELTAFAQQYKEFEKRNVKIIGLSIDSIYSHIAWLRDIEDAFNVEVKYPVIADLSGEVATLYGMIHPQISPIHAVRTLVIINPEGIISFIVHYPQGVGRNIDEIIRILDSMILARKLNIATPANWNANEPVIVPPAKTLEESKKAKLEKHDECLKWYLCKKKV